MNIWYFEKGKPAFVRVEGDGEECPISGVGISPVEGSMAVTIG